MKKLSDRMVRLLEHLAEMFPQAHYQSELDRYISSKYPQNAADVEYLTLEYQRKNYGGKFI
jgi:predicted transcriptional regulator with HTH domain